MLGVGAHSPPAYYTHRVIGISSLGKSFGGRTLFEGVSLQLNARHRATASSAPTARARPRSSKILAGDEPASEGSVVIAKRRAHRRAPPGSLPATTRSIILDVAMMGDELGVGRARGAATPSSSTAPATADAALADLEHDDHRRARRLHARGARDRRSSRASASRSRLHRQPLSTLSGGFKLRVLLAQVLLGGPDVLLLDEPTNHLDILSIRWLEKFLAGLPRLRVVISHDQRFLDNVATHILDVDYGTITLYTGNYTAFVAEKAAIRERKEAEIARAEEIIAEKQAFVERFGAKATKARRRRAASSRSRRSRSRSCESTLAARAAVPLRAGAPERARRARDLAACRRRTATSRCCATCRSWCGAARASPSSARTASASRRCSRSSWATSTPTRAPCSGATRCASATSRRTTTRCSSIPRRRRRSTTSGTPAPKAETELRARRSSGACSSPATTCEKPVGALSGGEAARLIFGRIMVEKPNVLVLDEPTNHLDLESIEALVEALRGLRGARVHLRVARSLVRLRARDAHPRGHAAGARATSPAPTTSTSSAAATITSTPTPWSQKAKTSAAASAPRQRSAAESGVLGGAEEADATGSPPCPRGATRCSRPSRRPRRARRSSRSYAEPGFFERTRERGDREARRRGRRARRARSRRGSPSGRRSRPSWRRRAPARFLQNAGAALTGRCHESASPPRASAGRVRHLLPGLAAEAGCHGAGFPRRGLRLCGRAAEGARRAARGVRLLGPHRGDRPTRRCGPSPRRIPRVVLVGPAHRVYVEGLASPGAHALRTPLGDVQVDLAGARRRARRPRRLHGPRARALARGAAPVPAERRSPREGRAPRRGRRLGRGGGPRARGALGRSRDARRHQLRSLALPAVRRGARHRSTDRRAHRRARRAPRAARRRAAASASTGCCGSRGARVSTVDLLDLRSSGDTAGPRGEVVGYGAFAFSEGGTA